MSSLIETFLIGGIIGGGAYLFMLWYDRDNKDSGEAYADSDSLQKRLLKEKVDRRGEFDIEDNPFNEGNIVYEDEFSAEELKELDAGIDADYELKEK